MFIPSWDVLSPGRATDIVQWPSQPPRPVGLRFQRPLGRELLLAPKAAHARFWSEIHGRNCKGIDVNQIFQTLTTLGVITMARLLAVILFCSLNVVTRFRNCNKKVKCLKYIKVIFWIMGKPWTSTGYSCNFLLAGAHVVEGSKQHQIYRRPPGG